MPLTDDELKAQMKAQAEAAIEKLFAEKLPMSPAAPQRDENEVSSSA